MYAMEYHSDINNDEKLTSKLMDLEIVILSRQIQTQKDEHCMFSAIWSL